MFKKLVFLLLTLVPMLCFSQLTDNDKDVLRKELSQRINTLRESKGLKALFFSDTLRKAAEFHSEYMAKSNILSHDEKPAKYANPQKRVIAFGGKDFELVGENVLYSTTQSFPLKKKDILALADEMFNSWKNSPGHYANMINPEYVFGDLGFKTNPQKGIVFATQVFGTKGHLVQNQLSNDIFGLVMASKECEQEFQAYSNLIMNLGNNLSVEGNEVILFFHDISYFSKVFSGPNDGIAIDMVSNNQLPCGKPNLLDLSPIYDGVMLKPYYATEIIDNNRAEGAIRLISKVGDIPDNLLGEEYSPSVILIKNGKACKYIYPATVPSDNYELRPIEPIVKDEPTVKLLTNGVVQSQIVNYDFKSNATKAINLPELLESNKVIHSIVIKSFSSVEGNLAHNEELYTSRAEFIQNHIKSKLTVSTDLFTIKAKENWDEMNFQLNYFERDELTRLSRDSLKAFLAKRDRSLPWDSLFSSQRKSMAVINYLGEFIASEDAETIAEFNLRTGVATGNVPLVNKALFEMYTILNDVSAVLFEPQIMEFIKMNPKTVGNYAALLSSAYDDYPYLVTDFIYSWIDKASELDNVAKSNLLHLYSLVGTYLLDNWDVSTERLSNVIHPLKIEKIISNKEKAELILNLHLTFIQYFGQVNDQENTSKSFNFIADYFKNNSLKKEDDVDLALFFNNWSMFQLTVDHLLGRFKQNKLNEDGLFVLAQTIYFTNYSDESELLLEVNKKALHSNPTRWCEWIENDFQVKRHVELKRMYCDSCQY